MRHTLWTTTTLWQIKENQSQWKKARESSKQVLNWVEKLCSRRQRPCQACRHLCVHLLNLPNWWARKPYQSHQLRAWESPTSHISTWIRHRKEESPLIIHSRGWKRRTKGLWTLTWHRGWQHRTWQALSLAITKQKLRPCALLELEREPLSEVRTPCPSQATPVCRPHTT